MTGTKHINPLNKYLRYLTKKLNAVNPPDTIKVTIIPAIATPREIAKNDFHLSSSKNHAAKAPVYAPVAGNGIATNIINPI